MLVVPLEKDTIITKDGLIYRVVEYTNFKDGGPAVYAKEKDGDDTLALVYFFDINKINKTQVEYQKTSKVFNALGRIKRAEHLPQPDDKITVSSAEDEVVEVKSLKLKSKSLGVNNGLFVQDTNSNYFRARDILTIDRAFGNSTAFDRDLFAQIYHDYLGTKD